ncbi:MAG: S8 family serine peptidase, partial [Planctomycetales bacterium]|nr:S8 family serine peptidase [Planctomycetales bacterium]
MHKQNQYRRGVHSNSGRKLRLERLESRRLLAGDAFNDDGLQSLQSIDGTFQAADAAGGSLATAAPLGQVHGTIQRGGTLSRVDRIDIASFEVNERSAVRVALDQMNRDADLYVLNRQGKQIASSTRSGTQLESLSGTLPAGRYYIAIVAMSHYDQSYRLTLNVQPRDSQPVQDTGPSNPPQATPSPAPSPNQENQPVSQPAPVPSPTTIGPLAEVAYFGGSQDWNINAVAAPESWAAGYRGQGVTVAVIDTGVDLDHPDLINSLYVNPGEIPGNGIDDDHNGFVDDVTGFDFVSGDARPDDGNGHGTHVAGTIAAGDNGVG